MESNFELQITALVDTLVIILIFLLKSMATDSLELDSANNLKIPSLISGISTGTGNRLSISADAISWNNNKFVNLERFVTNTNNKIEWQNLNAIIAEAVKAEKDSKTFTGKLFLQADKNAPYSLVQEALKTAKLHGYKDIRFVGAKYN